MVSVCVKHTEIGLQLRHIITINKFRTHLFIFYGFQNRSALFCLSCRYFFFVFISLFIHRSTQCSKPFYWWNTLARYRTEKEWTHHEAAAGAEHNREIHDWVMNIGSNWLRSTTLFRRLNCRRLSNFEHRTLFTPVCILIVHHHVLLLLFTNRIASFSLSFSLPLNTVTTAEYDRYYIIYA